MTRYKPDSAGMRGVANSPEMVAMVRQVAEEGMAEAVASAPVRTGDYKSRFSVTTTTNGWVKHDRAEARIVNDSGHAVLVEWFDGFHTMRDAAEELRAE